MPEDVQTYAARVAAATGCDGRLGIDPDGVVAWGVFPFEVEGLRLKSGPTLVDASSGRVQVALVRAVEALPSVARCHVIRVGDGGAHAHWWFMARPARMPELRGSFMVVWDDFLPPVPLEVRDANAAFVVERLVADLGGRAVRG